MKPIIEYGFEGQGVRVVERNGEPWFVLADVCRVLDIKNNRDAADRLDADEKGVALTDTLGGDQNMIVINESGLYTLILRSRSAVTPGTLPHRFRKWVTGELIPAVRKTGVYGDGRRPFPNASERVTLQREVNRLMTLLRRLRNADERRITHQMLAQTTGALGIDTPPIEALGFDAPEPDDQTRPFWNAINALTARGVNCNLHRRPDQMMAINVKWLEDQCQRHGIPFKANRTMTGALQHSKSPRFDKTGVCNTVLGKAMQCHMFALG